jgi:dihydrofolate reductase
VVDSIDQALQAGDSRAKEKSCSPSFADAEAFVIGGAEIFRQALPLCDRIYVTEIQAEFEGDVLFPEFNLEEWEEISRERYRWDENALDYHFVVLDRKAAKKRDLARAPLFSTT